MGKRPNEEPMTKIHVHLPKSLNDKLDLIFWNPMRQQPRYGARSRLINQLLQKWLRELPPAGVLEDQLDNLGE